MLRAAASRGRCGDTGACWRWKGSSAVGAIGEHHHRDGPRRRDGDVLVGIGDYLDRGQSARAVSGAEGLTGSDQIVFASSLFSSSAQTIDLVKVGATAVGNSALEINGNANITIIGPSGDNGLTLSAGGPKAMRLFDVTAGASLTLQNLTLTGGVAQGGHGGAAGVGGGGGGGGGAGLGGAIFNNGGTLTILDSTLTGNTAQGGQGTTGSFIGQLAPGGGGGGGGIGGYGGNALGFYAPRVASYHPPGNGPGGPGGIGGGGAGGFGGTAGGGTTNFESTSPGAGGSIRRWRRGRGKLVLR